MKKQTANQQLIADGFVCVEMGYWTHKSLGRICVWGKRGKWRAYPKHDCQNELGQFKTATEAVRALKAYARKY